jgi:type IV pilus assembly protein PilB
VEQPSLDPEALREISDEQPVIKLVNDIMAEAVKRGASDIHIEPSAEECYIRYRIDGVLQTAVTTPSRMRGSLVSRIKILAKVDISEKRLPQDGRIKIRLTESSQEKLVDFRVSFMPTVWGERIVMRLLDKERLQLDITKLGFEPEPLAKFQKAIFSRSGLLLVIGPTGSGKTTTLYSTIEQIKRPEVIILTAEDPVEFLLPGISQVQMSEQIGLNFASALRSFLRQDANVILVGEIRDFETAEIATKAARMGHLILSTLHTNDAPSTISRLTNMGIEPFLVASSLRLICAQRLVRRICSDCRVLDQASEPTLMDAGFTPEEARTVQLFKGAGCATCGETGYRGRIGLYEVMEITSELRDLILMGASALELKRKAIEQGMITLRRSGLSKVMAGITNLEEVLGETAP